MSLLFLLAQTAKPAPGNSIAGMLPLVLIAVVFYLLLIRPQRKRVRQQQALVESIAAGDRVVTIGGVHATVQSVDGETIRLEIAPGTVVTMSRGAVARKLVDADTAGGSEASP